MFGELALQGFIYRGLKPVLWCATCETALADAEVEYENHTSNSIYVRFPLLSRSEGRLLHGASRTQVTRRHPVRRDLDDDALDDPGEPGRCRASRRGVCRRARRIRDGDDGLLSRRRAAGRIRDEGGGRQRVRDDQTVRGAELEGLIFRHPLFHRTSPVVLADYVTMDTGTGIVHTAPGHGKEDFETGLRYGLEVLSP